MTENEITIIYDGEKGGRLDKFLVSHLDGITRSRIQKLIEDNLVTINKIPARKAGVPLDPGQTIHVRIPVKETVGIIAENIPLKILFENSDLIVINKPAGLVVHPSVGHETGTLVNAVIAHDPEMRGIGGEDRPGVVHRLDKETSGIILMAKNDATHHWLQKQFKDRKVEKTYLALVDGTPPTPRGRIEAPIGRDPNHRKRMAVVEIRRGRESITEYQTSCSYQAHTLLEVHPLTGRTHQIRVHLAFLGCPVVADTIYGLRKKSVDLDRHFLHAHRLRITLPGQDTVSEFIAPLPEELQSILDLLE